MKCRFCKIPVRVDIFRPAGNIISYNNPYNKQVRFTCERCGRIYQEFPEDIIRNRGRSCVNDEWMSVSEADAKLLAEQDLLLLEWI